VTLPYWDNTAVNPVIPDWLNQKPFDSFDVRQAFVNPVTKTNFWTTTKWSNGLTAAQTYQNMDEQVDGSGVDWINDPVSFRAPGFPKSTIESLLTYPQSTTPGMGYVAEYGQAAIESTVYAGKTDDGVETGVSYVLGVARPVPKGAIERPHDMVHSKLFLIRLLQVDLLLSLFYWSWLYLAIYFSYYLDHLIPVMAVSIPRLHSYWCIIILT
jgi:hypothetical protein